MRAPHRGGAGQSQVGRFLQVAGVRYVWREERRLEQPRVQLAHHLRSTHRGEIGRSLMAPLRAEGVPEREQDNGESEQDADGRDHHQRRLAARVAARSYASNESMGRHGTPPSPELRYL